MKDEKSFFKKHYIGMLCLIGMIGSIISLMIGYWVAGALAGNSKISFAERFCQIMKKPFSNYFGTYTPIIMVISFVVFEVLFFLILAAFREEHIEVGKESVTDKKDVKSEILESEKVPEVSEDVFCEDAQENTAEFSDFLERIGWDTEISENNTEENNEEMKKHFSNEISFRLIEKGYSNEQIGEMAGVLSYISDISFELLVKMFDVSMSAHDISEYIKLFYG